MTMMDSISEAEKLDTIPSRYGTMSHNRAWYENPETDSRKCETKYEFSKDKEESEPSDGT